MAKRAILVLADGSVYEGLSLGAEVDAYGEVVFNTSMTGYQEMLTDPSYAGQIVIPTYPLIGNYGINPQDVESARIQVRGFVVREAAAAPSHFLNQKTLHEYLAEAGVPAVTGLDTRAITRKLRSYGVMMGVLTSSLTPMQAMEILQSAPNYGKTDFVKEVSTKAAYPYYDPDLCLDCPDRPRCYPQANPACARRTRQADYRITVLDCGCKYNIMRLLGRLGCAVTVMPCTATAKEILAGEPDGVLLSPGPGNPEMLDYIVYNIRGLLGYKPIMGICLGHQLIARAFGGKTFKLPFGHRGGNHPVKDLATGRVYITAQNHGYAVDPDGLQDGLEVSYLNLNDGTVEGLRHKSLPIFTIQYHSEASPGPLDNTYLFEQFLEMVKREKH